MPIGSAHAQYEMGLFGFPANDIECLVTGGWLRTYWRRTVALTCKPFIDPCGKLFVIDFTGGGLEKEKPDSGIEPKVTVGEGATLVHLNLQKNPYNDTWRVATTMPAGGCTWSRNQCSL